MMVLDIEAMQLKNQNAVRDQPLVFRAAMGALAAEELLVPTATRLDVTHCNKRLGEHRLNLIARQAPVATSKAVIEFLAKQ